jgi:RNA polymerase sigma-70 factor (ECF subfamily)
MLRPLHHISDQELLDKLRCSEAAFTEIYNRYWDKLLYVSALKLQSVTMGEEIVQEIFLDLWKRRETLAINVSLEAYLSVAVKYRIINAHLKIKREQDYLKAQTASVLQADKWLDEKDLEKHFQILVSRLPKKCRITYQLSREAGLSLKEISQTMDISQKAVEANLTRSLKILRFGLKRILFFILSSLSATTYYFGF